MPQVNHISQAQAQEHWDRINQELARKRKALADQGFVVVSSEVYFPKDTDLSYRSRTKTLADYSVEELQAELLRRQSSTKKV